MTRGIVLFGAGFAIACTIHSSTPTRAPEGALAGRAPVGFEAKEACADWRLASAATHDGHVLEPDSFPELSPTQSCFAQVHFRADGSVMADAPPSGCAYPTAETRLVALREAARYDAIANGDVSSLPTELACELPAAVRGAVAQNNARTLRTIAQENATFAYAAVSAFGFGSVWQASSPLAHWLPGQACADLTKTQLDDLGINQQRVGRAALALAGGVAPVMTVSGGAAHSILNESIMMDWIATCRLGVPADRVLLDPCAHHTHSNIRNTGRLVAATGGRQAFLVTDDGLQSGYLEEWTFFDLMGGSIDQRALRDWKYLVGSWRRASDGIKGGYWFTPYRFWADTTLRDLRCAR